MWNNDTSGCRSRQPLPNGVNTVFVTTPVCFIIICENLLGMTVIWRSPELHTNANRFIFSLAIADINVALSYIIADFIPILEEVMESPTVNYMIANAFTLGNVYSGIILASTHMAVVAIDRYIYIAHPFYYIKCMTKRRNITTIVSIWLVAVVFEIIPLFAYTSPQYHQQCITSHPPLEYFASTAICHAISIILVCVSYLKIAHLGYKHKRATRARRSHAQDPHTIFIHKHCRTDVMKSIKFFVVMFGAFSVCTIIPGIYVTIIRFHKLPDQVTNLVSYFYLINSGTNFIIYTYMNKEFRNALKKTVSAMTRCCNTQNIS